MSGRIDWRALAKGVVTRLKGEPNLKLSRERQWRYGSKGSLSVDLDKAQWYDFEAKRGGGISKLIEYEIGGDWKAARRWLEAQGLIEPWKPDPNWRRGRGAHRRPSTRRGAAAGRRESGPDRKTADRGAEAASRDGPGGGADEAKRIGLAQALWAATSAVPESPGLTYLVRRGTWPWPGGFGDGWPEIPPAFRWIDRAALGAADPGLAATFPVEAAGGLLAVFDDVPGRQSIRAVSVEALTPDGARPAERWRRSRGVLTGAACVVPANPAGREIAIVEGEADALAVSLMARAGVDGYGDVAEVRCVAGTSGFEPDRAADVDGRPVVLMPDGPGKDGTGTAAGLAAACATRLRAAGRAARVRMRPEGDEAGDPAGDLAGLLVERSIRFERTDAGPDQADRQAWRSILGLEVEGGHTWHDFIHWQRRNER